MQLLWPLIAFALLAVHLIGVQIASAGPIVCSLAPKQNDGDGATSPVRRLAGQAVAGLLIGISSGLLLGWLATLFGSRDYTPIFTRFYHRIWWGGWELLFSLVLLIAYWLPWRYWRATRWRRFFHALIAAATATNLLYHFPPLLTIISEQLDSTTASTGPATKTITSAEYRALLVQPLVIAKSLHFIFAAFAMSCARLMLIARKCQDSIATSIIRRAALIAVTAVSLQMVIGVWLVMQIPANEQSALMGGDLLGSGMLLVSILLGFAALNQLGTIVMDGQGETTERQIWMAGMTVTAVITIMVGVAIRVSHLSG